MGARLLIAACAFALVACGGGSGPSLGGPPSTQSVAANDSDWSGLKKCPESGSFDHYLSAEKAKGSDQYSTDKTTWDDLKAGGADDSYVAVYAEDTSHCGEFGAGAPTSAAYKVAYVYAIRFKDASSATASYKADAKSFHLDDAEVSQLRAAGATVKQGAETGLGSNSVELTVQAEAESVFAAFWQNKTFEVAIVTFNEGDTNEQAASKINGRIS